MPLINTSLTNLIQGVSQQPDAVKFPGQCAEQENALSSIVDGLQKRPATRHISRILREASVDADAKVHFIERDANERYVVIIKGTDTKELTAYSLKDGTQATIAQRYRAVITSSAGAGVANGDYYEYTFNLSQRPPVEFTAVGSGSADNYVRVVDGADTSATKFDLLSVTQTGDHTGQIKFKVEGDTADTFSLKGTGTGELQNTIDYYIAAASSVEPTYLKTKDDGTNTVARKDLKTLTTGDFTYLLNTQKTVTKDSVESASLNKNALVFIKQGDYEKKYGVRVEHNGNTYENWVYSGASQAKDGSTYYNTAKNAQADHILATLFSDNKAPVRDASGEQNVDPDLDDKDAATNRALHTDVTGSLLTAPGFTEDSLRLLSPRIGEIRNLSNEDFTIYPVDSMGGEGIGVAHKSVTSLLDLPKVAPHRFKIKIRGDIEEQTDDRFVTFLVAGSNNQTNETSVGQGSWVESAGDRVNNRIDAHTMPLILKSTGENVFELCHMPLDALGAGDLNTNPDPSFVNSTISGIFQFKGRLGFLSNASVSLTEVKFGSYAADNDIQNYNFYRTTVVSLLDGDPIDVTLSSANVVKLKDAMAFQDNLVMFSDYGQFVLRGGDLLTPKSVSANPITEFEYDSSVSPVALGSFIYFPFARGKFTGVREFTVNSNTDVFDANEITAHVPQYITQKLDSNSLPEGLVSMTGCSSEELLAVTDGEDIYIYKYFFSGNEKLLSSWSKFTLGGGGIRGIGFVDSDLYIVQSPANVNKPETHLLKIPLANKERDVEGYNIHLDKRVEITLNADAAAPSFTLPYYLSTGETLQAYTADGLFVQNLDVSEDDTNTTVSFVGDIVPGGISGSAVKLYVGVGYGMKYTFSEQIFKASAGEKASPTNSGRMLIRNGSIFFQDTSHFVVKVTPNLRSTSKSEFNATIVQATTEGSMPLETNSFRFPVFTDPKGTVITIENDSAAPCNLQSAEFESFVHQRSSRYG
tara:strand:- start:5161 stop:8103 length:2943 start_codon:yes stop_codon:yes gene_type:complete